MNIYAKFLYEVGLNTNSTMYPSRAEVVLEWWGLWGLMYFKKGYEAGAIHG